MASSLPGDGDPLETRIDLMMRMLGIDVGAASAVRLPADYVAAVQTCKTCARKPICPALAVPGLAGSLDPEVCPNAERLMQLMLDALPRPDDGHLN